MKKRQLGKTDMYVSEVAFGGVEIGMPYGIGVESEKDMLSEKGAIYLLHAAVDKGINFFDTAREYKRSESIMGEAFKTMRERVVISTKCTHLYHENEKRLTDKELRRIIENSLHSSLEALRTDYVDVFMLHDVQDEILKNTEIAGIFSDLKKSGKVRSVGVSTYLPEETKYALETEAWDVIQLPFNLLDQRQKESFDLASQKGVGIVVRSVLFKGLLSNRAEYLHPALKKVKDHIASYNKFLNEKTPDLSTLATKFALSFNTISSVLVGMDRIEYLQKSLDVADGDYFDNEILSMAEKLSYPDPAFLNLPYWDKMGWLK